MIRKVVRNTFFLSVSQGLARAIGLFYTIFLARALGVESFGVYTFAFVFLCNFIPVADFGIERVVLRDIPRAPAKASFYLTRLLPLRFLLWLGTYFGVLALEIILGRSTREIFYLAVLGLSLLPYSLTYLLASFQNARERMEYMSLANIATIGLTAIIGLGFVVAKLSLIWIFFAYVLGNLLVAIFFLARAGSWQLVLGWVPDTRFWKEILSQSWIFAVLVILSVWNLRLSMIMLGILGGAVATGLYGSAFKFIEAIILLPQALALALFPLSARLFVADPGKLKLIYKRGLGILFLFSLPFAFLLMFFPELIINLVYGLEYLKAASVLPILGLAIILFFVNALPGNIILNSPKVNYFLPVVFFYFVTELVLCLILIPRYSIIGAAWAVVGSELVGLVINNLFVWRILRD